MDHVVVDVEIQKPVETLPGKWNDTHLMGVAVAVVYEFKGDRFRIYGPQDVDALRTRLLAADRISGYNIARFDFPVIWSCRERDLPDALAGQLAPKTDDLLLRIWSAMNLSLDHFTAAHRGWTLDNVARGTLNNAGKIANGAQAPLWFQDGDWGKVANYCVDDVALERDLTVFVDRYGFVINGESERLVRVPAWTASGKPKGDGVDPEKVDKTEYDVG